MYFAGCFHSKTFSPVRVLDCHCCIYQYSTFFRYFSLFYFFFLFPKLRRVQKIFKRVLTERKVGVHTGKEVVDVTDPPEGVAGGAGALVCSDGTEVLGRGQGSLEVAANCPPLPDCSSSPTIIYIYIYSDVYAYFPCSCLPEVQK